MDYDLQVTVDDEPLLFGSLMVDETERVVRWTSYANKTEWARGCWNEEPAAQKAVYLTLQCRKGNKVRWEDAKFKDGITCRYVDAAGRHVVLAVQLDDDGLPILDDDGDPKPRLKDGRPVLLYADTGEEVPPTDAGSDSTPTSATPATPGSTTASESGIQPTEQS